MEEARRCRTCGETKPLNQFNLHYNKRKSDSPRLDCKKCDNARRLEQRSRTPEAFIRTVVSQLRSGRRRRGEVCEISTDEVIALYHKQNGKCALSGTRMTHLRTGKERKWGHISEPTNISVDRIVPDGPYEIENIQLVCNAINFMKWCWPEEEFIDWCSRVHGERRGRYQGSGDGGGAVRDPD